MEYLSFAFTAIKNCPIAFTNCPITLTNSPITLTNCPRRFKFLPNSKLTIKFYLII